MDIVRYIKNYECDIVELSISRKRKYFPEENICVANIELENFDNFKWLIKHTYAIFEEGEEDLEKAIENGKELSLAKLVALIELDIEEQLFEEQYSEIKEEDIKVELAKMANFLSFPKCKEIIQQSFRNIDLPYINITMPSIEDIIIDGDDTNVGHINS